MIKPKFSKPFSRSLPALMAVFMSATVLVLTACGGGGGGSATAAASAADAAALSASTASAAAAAASLPVATLVASSYAAGSEERDAFNLLNFERSSCGFGTLTQSLQLDAAARAHADYQILNSVVSHTETFGKPGFTGVFPSERIAAQGYTGAGQASVTDEIVALIGTDSKTGLGASGVRGLLSAPYHLRGLVGGYRDMGVSIRSSADLGTSTPTVVLQINAAYKTSAGPQLLGSTDIKTYPCEGTTGVNFQLTNESPNPIPGRDLALQPLGAVVYVSVREGNTLSFSASAPPTMTQVSNGQAVALRTPVTAANDPYAPCLEGCFKRHQAYIAADAPVQANTEYRVQMSGTNNSIPFTRSFVFRTGSGG